MDRSLPHRRARGSMWARWALCALLAWPAAQALAGPGSSAAPGIGGQTLAVGDWHTCAIRHDGRMTCWELGASGPSTPLEGHFVSVASGRGFSCGLRSDGEAVCAGPANRLPPPPPGPWRSLAAGSEEACGLRPDGRLQCWGRSDGVGAGAPGTGRFVALSMSTTGACAIRTDGTPLCWSDHEFVDLSDVPPGRFTRISVASAHACALRSDGRIVCWGDDFAGPAPAESGFAAVQAGNLYNCALRGDATIACWGMPITGGLNAPQGRFAQLSIGMDHACAVGIDGMAQCWGGGSEQWLMNERGIGLAGVVVGGGEACALDAEGEPHCQDGVPQMRPAPGRYSQLSLGGASGCGILSDQRVACWGASLGPTPTAAMSTLSVGEAHACGVRTDGAVVCWGDNAFGQTAAPSGRHLTVVAGDRYSCAITVGGTVECWGQDPLVSGIPVGNGFRTLLASKDVVCANRDAGPAACWGDGGRWLERIGQVGRPVAALGDHFACWRQGGQVLCDGDDSRGVPVFQVGGLTAVAAAGGRVCAIDGRDLLACRGSGQFDRQFNVRRTRLGIGTVAAGAAHTCNADSGGLIDCWGDNAFGQRDAPKLRAGGLDASADRACAIGDANTLQCWGDDSRGGGAPLPGVAVRHVDIGQYNGCAVRDDGGASCWGWNANGQSAPPADAFRRVATGLNHSCGLRDDGTLTCWGYGADGQTAAPAGEFVALDVGERHSCAIGADGLLSCWGMDGEGQSTPPAEAGATYRALSAGSFHNCAIRSDGALGCWGRNDRGQSTPPPGRFASVSAGVAHSCAIRDDGARVCWGSNDSGQSPSLAIGPDALPRGERTQRYEALLTATGSAGYTPRAATFRVVSGALPSGIELDAGGLLHGQPQANGVSNVVVDARDLNGFGARRDYRIQIGPSDDTTPPRIEAIVTGPMGDDGWHVGDVAIRWLYDDPESGIEAVSGCLPFVLTDDSNAFASECRVHSRGGGGHTAYRILKRDATPPRIDIALQPQAPNDAGWYRVPVEAAYTCSDATSGLAVPCPPPAGFPSEGVHALPSRPIRDHAGNVAQTPATAIRIDTTRPQLSAIMPPAQLFVGATHDFQLSATDALSGIASQSCTPIDTATPSAPGTRLAACTAMDRAGNSVRVNSVYEVVPQARRTGGAGQPAGRAPPQRIRRLAIPAKPRAR